MIPPSVKSLICRGRVSIQHSAFWRRTSHIMPDGGITQITTKRRRVFIPRSPRFKLVCVVGTYGVLSTYAGAAVTVTLSVDTVSGLIP